MRSPNLRQLFRRISRGMFVALMTAGFFATMAMLPIRGETHQPLPPLPRLLFAVLSPQPGQAQQRTVRIEEAAEQVYALEPDLPLENQYVSEETGQASDRNTLVSRLIRYHAYVKGRPLNYRLDWKLTLADYLGANERVISSVYPGHDTLRPSPLPGDIAAINGLTRHQRDRLVNALVSIYAPAPAASETPPATAPATPADRPANPVSPAPRPAAPSLQSPQPGDAQLLAP